MNIVAWIIVGLVLGVIGASYVWLRVVKELELDNACLQDDLDEAEDRYDRMMAQSNGRIKVDA